MDTFLTKCWTLLLLGERPFICENPFPILPHVAVSHDALPSSTGGPGIAQAGFLSCAMFSVGQDNSLLCEIPSWPRRSHTVSFLGPESQMPVACRVYSSYSGVHNWASKKETRQNIICSLLLHQNLTVLGMLPFKWSHLKLLGMCILQMFISTFTCEAWFSTIGMEW